MAMAIRIKRIRLGGVESIDIRRCKDGYPTKSGVSLPPELVEAVIEALRDGSEVERYIRPNP